MTELKMSYEIDPICPHYEETLETVLLRELKGMLGRRYLYFCGACHRSLGISHRKGFFMG